MNVVGKIGSDSRDGRDDLIPIKESAKYDHLPIEPGRLENLLIFSVIALARLER